MDSTQTNVFAFDWSYPPAFCWGLLVLTAFVGWGQVIGSWLMLGEAKEDFGWGMAAAWGMAAFLVLAGPLIMVSLFSVTFLVIFLTAGLISAAWHAPLFWRRILRAWPRHPVLLALLVILLLLIALTYAGAVGVRWYSCWDDFEAYFPFSKMLLDAGTLRDPFYYRMVDALQGQPALVTLVVAFLSWKYAHLLDIGITGLIILGLMQDMVRGNGNRAWTARLVLITLALTFPMPRYNTASEFTGVALFIAFLRSLELVTTGQTRGWRAALLLGGVIAATATLRCHYLFILAPVGIVYAALRLWEGGQKRREVAREALMTLGASILLLAPWWVVTYRSNGSFLYPLVHGTQRPDYNEFSLHLPLVDTLQFIGGFFLSSSYALMFLPILFLDAGRQRRELLIFGGLILLLSAGFMSQSTMGTYFHLTRYLFPIGLPLGLYTCGIMAQQLLATPLRRRPLVPALRAIFAVILVSLALLLESSYFWDASIQNIIFFRWGIDAQNGMTTFTGPEPVELEQYEPDYRKAFAQIPSDGKTLIALDYPFLLDYRTHKIFSVDLPGAASPDPGMPLFHGPEAIKKYLLDQGIRYFAYVPFENGLYLYSRSHEESVQNGPYATPRYEAKFGLDFFDSVEQLAKTNRILYESPVIRVIDLGG